MFSRKLLYSMRYTVLLLVVLLPLAGCGPAVLDTAATVEDVHISHYLIMHEVRPEIAEAMRDHELHEGMRPEEVRLVMEVKGNYTTWPNEDEETAAGRRWTYVDQEARGRAKKIHLSFEGGTLTRIQHDSPDPLIDL